MTNFNSSIFNGVSPATEAIIFSNEKSRAAVAKAYRGMDRTIQAGCDLMKMRTAMISSTVDKLSKAKTVTAIETVMKDSITEHNDKYSEIMNPLEDVGEYVRYFGQYLSGAYALLKRADLKHADIQQIANTLYEKVKEGGEYRKLFATVDAGYEKVANKLSAFARKSITNEAGVVPALSAAIKSLEKLNLITYNTARNVESQLDVLERIILKYRQKQPATADNASESAIACETFDTALEAIFNATPASTAKRVSLYKSLDANINAMINLNQRRIAILDKLFADSKKPFVSAEKSREIYNTAVSNYNADAVEYNKKFKELKMNSVYTKLRSAIRAKILDRADMRTDEVQAELRAIVDKCTEGGEYFKKSTEHADMLAKRRPEIEKEYRYAHDHRISEGDVFYWDLIQLTVEVYNYSCRCNAELSCVLFGESKRAQKQLKPIKSSEE